jgi:hypothetical protein
MKYKSVALVILILSFVSILSFCPLAFSQYSELVGKEVELRTYEGKAPIYVGVDKRMFNLLTGNLMGVNKQGYLATVLRHKGFEVENYTKARVLETNFWERTAKVEIIDGGYAGRVGWVLINCVSGY